jgi:type IV pilus assembly protein PilN
MISINLLPYRERVRQRRRQAFRQALWLALLLGGLLAALAQWALQEKMQQQQARNQLLLAELQKMDLQIASMARLREEIARLQARRLAVENLQAGRHLPVRVLTDLAQKLPPLAYLTSLHQDSQRMTLQGVARSNETVSEFLRNLDQAPDWYSQPELQEIVAAPVQGQSKQKVKAVHFTIRLQLPRAAGLGDAPTVALQPVARRS